jgi:hypothetical protein
MNIVICTLRHILLGWRVAWMGEMRSAFKILVRKPELGDPGIDGRIIL